MKARRLLVIVCLLLAAIPLASQDFGLDISNTTVYQYSDVWSLIQKNTASLWFNFPIGQSVNLYLSGFYEFSGSFSDAENVVSPARFDVGQTYFALQPNLASSSLKLSLGRVETADSQSAVYSGLMDGFSLLFRKGNTRWSLGTGYLGLLNKNDALVLLDDDDSAIYTDDAVYFSTPRLVAMFGYAVDDLLKGFDLGFELWSQFDYNSTTATTNTIYYEPSFTYRPFASLSVSGFGVLSMLMNPEVHLGYAYGFEASYKMPKTLGLSTSLRLFTSGGNSDSFDSFKPIKFTTVSANSSGVIGDATSISAKISITPVSTMILAVDGGILLRDGSEVPAGYASGSESVFIGTEYGVQLLWLMASDVVFMTGGGLFAPNRLGAYPTDAPDEWTGIFSLIIKM